MHVCVCVCVYEREKKKRKHESHALMCLLESYVIQSCYGMARRGQHILAGVRMSRVGARRGFITL